MSGLVPPSAILETVLYAEDLDQARRFYRDVLGLEPVSEAAGRHLFYRMGDQMLLLFNPRVTRAAPPAGARLPVPPHGATGPGHVCFAATAEEIGRWRTHLKGCGVQVEAELIWPGGGHSLYFRDPAGNCLEFAEPTIWGIGT